MKLFIIESAEFTEMFTPLNERESLAKICCVFEFETHIFTEFSKSGLKFLLNKINEYCKASDEAIYLHLSCHGNSRGLRYGDDHITWEGICLLLAPFVMDVYKDRFFLSISACGTNEQKITKKFRSVYQKMPQISPPAYVFIVNQEEVDWNDALISWGLFYHQMREFQSEIDHVQLAVNVVNSTGLVSLKYYRWNPTTSTYKTYLLRTKKNP